MRGSLLVGGDSGSGVHSSQTPPERSDRPPTQPCQGTRVRGTGNPGSVPRRPGLRLLGLELLRGTLSRDSSTHFPTCSAAPPSTPKLTLRPTRARPDCKLYPRTVHSRSSARAGARSEEGRSWGGVGEKGCRAGCCPVLSRARLFLSGGHPGAPCPPGPIRPGPRWSKRAACAGCIQTSPAPAIVLLAGAFLFPPTGE